MSTGTPTKPKALRSSAARYDLAGDKYFKVRQPGQNLNRARVQFRLCEAVEAREGKIRDMIKRL